MKKEEISKKSSVQTLDDKKPMGKTSSVKKPQPRKTLIQPVLAKSAPAANKTAVKKKAVKADTDIKKSAVKKTAVKSPSPAAKEVKNPKTVVKKTIVKKVLIKKSPASGRSALLEANDTVIGESKKFEIEDKRGYSEPSYHLKGEEIYSLPEEYGDTKITLLIQDPYWIHAYWEINSDTRKKFGLTKAGGQKKLTLRIYDSSSSKRFFDIQVNENAKSWYFQVPIPNLPYYSEIGILEGSLFKVIARSNQVFVPTDKSVPVSAVQTAQEAKKSEALFEKSGGYIIHKLVGSQVVSEWGASPIGMSSGSGGISSGSGGMGVNQPVQQRNFWAELHTELIVYGSTEPSAKVTVGGMPVHLNHDGRFSVRFYLKDGQHSVPFTAVSRDDRETISITPYVNKSTDRKESKR